MKKYLILPLILLVLIAVACNKDEEEPLPEPPTNYQPISPGSYWTYSGYGGGMSYNMEISGLTDSIDGDLWYGLNHTLFGEGWFKKKDGIYYNRYHINGILVELPYLVDNQKVGHTWETQVSLAGINSKLTYTITERDTSKVVSGQLYQNVIVVQMDTDFDLGMGFGTIDITGKYWYANDVGFIFSDVSGEGMTYLEFYELKN